MLQARVLGTVLLLVGLCLPAAVRGEEPPLKSELARRHYELGEQHFKRARYDSALEEFRKARQLDARPALLFNIGRCLEYLGQLAEARDHYRRYLIEEPDSPHREMVRRRIKSIEFELSRKQESPAPPAPAPEKPGRSRESGTWRGTAGWITVGVGGAALVTGAVFGGLVQSKTKSYEDAWARGETYSELESIARDGERYETAQWATLIAGGVLAAGGVALLLWHYLGRDKRQDDAASVRLLPGPGLGAAVGLEL